MRRRRALSFDQSYGRENWPYDKAGDSLFDAILNSLVIMHKVSDDLYAQQLYATLCNTKWSKTDSFSLLKEDYWRCSWRSSAKFVAGLRNLDERYNQFYCSGNEEDPVSEEILCDIRALGWIQIHEQS